MRALLATAAVGALAVLLPGSDLLARGEEQPPRRPTSPVPEAPSGTGNTARLLPSVQRAVDRAVAAASADGVALRVTSGWRSATHQKQLFEAAVAKYGTRAAARRWVLPPDESAHVTGAAVDVGPAGGARWLQQHGVRFGLCQRYDNEPWHFELLAAAKGSDCPPREPHP